MSRRADHRYGVVGGLSRLSGRFLGLGVLLAATLLSGCQSGRIESQRLEPYRPAIAANERSPWSGAAAGRPVASPDNPAAPPTTSAVSLMERGDRVTISLRGIPRPEDISEVIDDNGEVTLPLVAGIRIEGLTSSEAEERIEKAYINSGYYREINVIIVAQDDVFFVRGEAQRPGQYVLNGDVTLMMAIATAGGYTEWANRRKVRIIRQDQVLINNANRIDAREDPDPLIQADDIIILDRKRIL